MSKKLIIAEKPSLATDIANEIGAHNRKDGYYEATDYIITWAVGHLIKQASPEAYLGKVRWHFKNLPIKRDKIIMQETDDKRSAKQLKVIKKLLASATHVIHAGDNDREGQLIIDEILDFYHFEGHVDRLLINDKNIIGQALKDIKPNSEFANISNAAWARSIADWDVGMNLSQALSLSMTESLGVGRVQTPVLRMIVDRHSLIHDFSEHVFFAPVAKCTHENGSFSAAWQSKPDTPTLDDKGRITEKVVAESVAKDSSGKGFIKALKSTKKKEAAPLGYVLGKIQSDAGKRFGMSLDDSMAVCQSLYDKKKVMTYPRVECVYLPSTMLADIDVRIAAIKSMVPSLASLCDKADLSLRSKIWNDKKVAEESHHALMFTGVTAKLTADEQNIMTLIGERILMQFLPQHEYTQTEVLVGNANHSYKAFGKVSNIEGWKEVVGGTTYSDLPPMNDGESLDIKVTVDRKTTKPPLPYTRETLMDDMMTPSRLTSDPDMIRILKKAKGIGTPATRPSVLARLFSHELVKEKKKGKLKIIEPTDKGKNLIAKLSSIGGEKASDPCTTALWELCFDNIAKGKLDKDDFLASQREMIAEIIESAKATAPKDYDCPDCGSTMSLRNGKFGKFYGCHAYPKCKTVLNEDGKKKESKPKADLEYGDDCFKCGKRTVKRNGKNGVFYACEGYPKCNYSYNPDAEQCSECGTRMKAGKSGWWCSVCKDRNK